MGKGVYVQQRRQSRTKPLLLFYPPHPTFPKNHMRACSVYDDSQRYWHETSHVTDLQLKLMDFPTRSKEDFLFLELRCVWEVLEYSLDKHWQTNIYSHISFQGHCCSASWDLTNMTFFFFVFVFNQMSEIESSCVNPFTVRVIMWSKNPIVDSKKKQN